ncbi:MAG: BREX system P-loop protein BrxC [Alphaproteobacteria bacterium]|nr:BREX system P-loop protein BrxC [Alphaproteobacteria bacterium]
MQILNDIFTKPINRPIEGVIKADDAASLRMEVEEYVLTRELSDRLASFVSAYNTYGTSTNNGVWISGFFGSGKSHLLKMLALLLENSSIDNQRVLDMFLPKCADQILRADLKKACLMSSKSILFNIDQKSDAITTKQTDALLSVFVKVFDEMCGYYGKQGYIAKFERDLNSRGFYGQFKDAYEKISKKSWLKGREQAILEGRNIAKAYAAITGEPEDIANGIIDKYRRDYKLSIEDFAEQVKGYIDKQEAGFRLNFFVDEVGQYIADNVKLMLNLQSIAEALATKCRGQAWVIVTAQEDMTSVFGEFGKQQGNDFSKIQARFAIRLKLTSANVGEVIKKRLLDKKSSSLSELEKIYTAQQNNFKTLFGFVDGSQTYKPFVDFADFSSCYPFVPYQFTLFQSSIQGLSEHNVFEGKHNSVGERSMLGVFQTVAVQLSEHKIGSLATFDLMYEAIRQAVKSNAVHAIHTAEQHLSNPLAVRVLKTLFLVKYYRPFKASARNISILLQSEFGENSTERLKQVQEALNKLESESYIQRNGELYEYLTDEEQDIEKEIKNTGVDTLDVVEELNKILFEQIIGGMKIRYVGNGQDYTLGKKMDGRNLGIERELSIHIITPWYERNTGEDFRTASWGQAELLVAMPPDARLMSDVTILLKTLKFAKQNSNSQNENTRRILDHKMTGTRDRELEIKARAEELLVKAELLINGRKLDCTSENAKQRIIAACQELIQFHYANLKILGNTNYQERNIATYFTQNTAEMFSDTLSEAETEVLNMIRATRSSGLRITIKALRDKLNMRPYGWYDAAILCIIAKLAVRGKLELRSDGNLLEDQKLIAALKNSHAHDNVTLESQADYSPAQIKKVKDFYTDYFQEPANACDPKQLGMDLLERLRNLVTKLTDYDSRRTHYPFLGELEMPLAKLKAIVGKPASFFFADCPQSDLAALCDDKEDFIDPIIAFMSGNGKEILDAARKLMKEQDSNLSYIPHEEKKEIEDIVRDPRCFKGKRMPRLKELTDALTSRIAHAVSEEVTKAEQRMDELKARFAALPDYAAVGADRQQDFASRFDSERAKFKEQHLIAVIRDQLRHFEENTYKHLTEEIYTLAHPIKSDKPKTHAVSVPMPKQHVNFTKPWLENDADLDAYFIELDTELVKVKVKLRELIKNGNRIQL